MNSSHIIPGLSSKVAANLASDFDLHPGPPPKKKASPRKEERAWLFASQPRQNQQDLAECLGSKRNQNTGLTVSHGSRIAETKERTPDQSKIKTPFSWHGQLRKSLALGVWLELHGT